MRVEIVTTAERLAALEPDWTELLRKADASILSSHRFLSAWWRAFGGVDELRVLAAYLGEELVALWPLYLRAARTSALGARTLTPIGDLRAMERTVVASPGSAGPAVASMLVRLLELRDWDFLDAPREDDQIMEALARVALQAGNDVQIETAPDRAVVELPPLGTPAWDELVRAKRPLRGVAGAAYAPAELDVAHAIDELHRLLRREWAERDQASPAIDPASAAFLKDVLPEMTRAKRARIGLVALAGVGAIAADVVVVDGDRHAQVLRGTDPEHAPAGATEQLCWSSLELAAKSGARRFELADDDSSLRTTRIVSERLQLWNGTAVGRVHRGVASLRGKRTLSSSKPRNAIGRVLDRIGPDTAQKLVARLGNYKTFHLYRGELFTREVDHSASLRLSIVDLAAYEAMAPADQTALVTRLELSAGYTMEKWRRGDLAVVASVDGRPAGIAWCARAPVFVPDIGHKVQPLRGECYIHDVFVHPDDRGRKIAPAMLEHLALHLRGRDVYRAWALIERTNSPSVRAFERAAYVAVADVIYVDMGIGSHLFVRPPDPEARAFLGV
jgi:ribosomal protein S18 acetylase RimI-like enzyme